MANISVLEQDAISFAQRAVKCDQSGLADTASFYYTEAAQALVTAAMAGSQMPGILDKVSEYQSRAQLLKHSYGAKSSFITQAKSPQQLQLERARFLVEQAFDEDESGNQSDALELYTQAAELCVTLRNQNLDRETHHKVTKLAQQALDRAEQLKPPDPLANAPSPPSSPSAARREVSNKTIMPGPLGFSLREDQMGQNTAAQPARRGVGAAYGGGVHAGVGGASTSGGGAGEYTKEEIHVLRTTSCINGRNFVPFMAADLKERFGYPVPFGDRDGKLALSPKQRSRLEGWRRPEDIMSNPQMIYAVSSFSIKQTIVSDCSFVASLAISAQYERRFNTKLITSIIYPQNRKGEPQYNPCGKYMVKLNINGVPRKVIIDDYLPVGRGSDLLCSYSNNRNELWVSLLEKAYMKVMGGYDFPGSNSNIDLNALTGWIPERVAIRPGSSEFDPDKEFKKIKDRFHRGDCLVTVATGELSQDEADRAGLVSTHAYAMLDIIEIKGFKLFQLKNPWSHMRWRGNFSELDKKHWTPDLQKALNFNPDTAASVDNGVFWIDYESMMKFFDVIYINWRPSIFEHTTCMHYTWTAKEGPKKDLYNIGDNPQYRLEVKAKEGAVVWILLTRHITDKDDFANNREFITLVVYKTDGRRIFYPSDPPPHKDGVRINSPHYLCKMVQDKGTGVYTLVVSQYEKNNTIHYTLRVYCTCDFKLSHIKEPYNPKYEKQVTGEWKGRTAGGCPNYPDTFPNNPIYQLRVDKPGCHVLVELRGPKNCSVGFTIVAVDVPGCPDNLKRQSSGAYRPGFCVLEVDNLPRGVYNIQPCTFLPNQELPFFLNISASTPISLSHMQ